VQEYTEKNGFALRVRDYAQAHGESDAGGRFDLTLRERGTFYLRVWAEGLAPSELGPFEIDPAHGLDGLEIDLGEGGAIEGQVLVAPGESPAGKIVAISRGDAHAVTQRVGKLGRYRFEHLIPGKWLVVRRDAEITPEESTASSDMRTFREEMIRGNCTVAPGATTHFDLDLVGGAAAVVLEGLLVLDDAPCTGWEAQLLPAGRMTSSSDSPPVTTDSSDGSFRLEAPRAGRYRLSLAPLDDSGRLFSSVVELFPGSATWSRSFATGAVEVLNPGPASELDTPLDFFLTSVQGVDVLAPVPVAESGSARIAGLPAGAGRIARFTLEQLAGLAEFPRSHPALVEVEVRPDRTTSVHLP